MELEIAYPHIEKAEGQPARLKRTPRVRIAQIAMDYLAHGWSPDEMCRQHPYLSPAEAHAAMTYYFDHQSEIDREIEDELDEAQTGREASSQSALALKLRARRIAHLSGPTASTFINSGALYLR